MNFYEFLPKKLNFSEFIEIFANFCQFFDVFCRIFITHIAQVLQTNTTAPIFSPNTRIAPKINKKNLKNPNFPPFWFFFIKILVNIGNRFYYIAGSFSINVLTETCGIYYRSQARKIVDLSIEKGLTLAADLGIISLIKSRWDPEEVI